MSTRGKIHAAGVGPGDPEYLTLKALRIIRECDIVAVPAADPSRSAAYKIAAAAVPEISEKECIGLDMPMTNDWKLLQKSHRKASDILESLLDSGKNIAYLTLGDVGLYSTFSYIKDMLEDDGYEVFSVSGISSAGAAAARLGITLAKGNEALHIVTGDCSGETLCGFSGTCVIMKPGRHMGRIWELLEKSGRKVYAVENCGMADEKIYYSMEDIPDNAVYFTVLIAVE